MIEEELSQEDDCPQQGGVSQFSPACHPVKFPLHDTNAFYHQTGGGQVPYNIQLRGEAPMAANAPSIGTSASLMQKTRNDAQGVMEDDRGDNDAKIKKKAS